jgi:hypothetical protein
VEILTYNLDQTDAIDEHEHKRIFAEQLSSIIGTCNDQLVSIALEVYYTQNTFKVTIGHGLSRYDGTWNAGVSHPPSAYGHHIRKMEVDAGKCDGDWPGESVYCGIINGWPWILTPDRPELLNIWLSKPRTDLCDWQASYPHLRTLHFSLNSKFWGFDLKPGLCSTCGVPATTVEALMDLLQECSLGLQAEKATAVVDRIPDDDGYYDYNYIYYKDDMDDYIPCECFKSISDRIAEMATKPKK